MKIIVGLGNPGRKYKHTPHNVGFAVVDELAERLSCKLRRSLRFNARTGSVALNGEKIFLVEPQTYMNNSGFAVSKVLSYLKADPSDLLVVLDDADLDFGRIRIKTKGGSGGHNGLASVIQQVGNEEFARIRLGIGRDAHNRGLVKHVLEPFSAEEKVKAEEIAKNAAEAVLCVLDSGTEIAMNKFNKRTEVSE